MPGYVDGFLLPVPKKNLAKYKKIAKLASRVWRDHGALKYIEASGDDLNVKFGVSMEKAANAKRSEATVFAFIVYKSKAHRNAVNKKVMKDKRLAACMDGSKMPFDVKRMAWGGFKVLVEA